MSRYLITGGAGFIGSHLANLLIKNGKQVTIIDDLSTGSYDNIPKTPNINFINDSILNKTLLEKSFCDVSGVFHLAAIASVRKSIDNWYYSHQVNLAGTINVFLHAAERNIPVVYASSAAVYGASKNLPLSEASLASPLSPYAVDKYICEIQAKILGTLKGLKSFGLRFFNVYGEGQSKDSDYSGVISIFKQRINRGEKLTIFGDGEQCRDFIHISDIVDAILLAMDATSSEGPVANICTGKPYTLNQLVEILSQISSISGILYEPSQLGSIKLSIGDPSLAEKIMGFKAKQDFNTKLIELILA
ncbi:MAG: NAD-dependent epimerase/dehydratase family protein [Janthinobacterium lividum]